MTPAPLLSLKVLSPEGTLLEVHGLIAINVPLADGGAIGVRPGHAPLIAETTQGSVRYRDETEDHEIEILPGVLDISENVVTILTAGKVSEAALDPTNLPNSEFTRLIQNLAHRLYPEDDKPEDAA